MVDENFEDKIKLRILNERRKMKLRNTNVTREKNLRKQLAIASLHKLRK